MIQENKCVVCGSNKRKPLYTNLTDQSMVSHYSYNLYRCSKCGHIYLLPKRDRKEIQEITQYNYWPHKIHNEFFENIEILMTKECKILMNIPPSKILDVGCGSGKLINFLKNKGWLVFGVDISKIAVYNARKRGLDNVYYGELPEINFSKNEFDVILLRHSIEHLFDIETYLRCIYEILKDRGLLIISTPNIESREFKIFRRYWYQLDIPRHLNLFSSNTIKKLLSRCGFIVEKIYTDYRPFFSFSKSMLYKWNLKNSIFRLIDNIIVHTILLFIFFTLHSDTSIIVIANKNSLSHK